MQAPNEIPIHYSLLRQIYRAIQLANGSELLSLLEQNKHIAKTLFSLPIKEANNANIIQAILFKLDAVRDNEPMSERLFACLSDIISKYPKDLNLQFCDTEKNTTLHKVFWYAIKDNIEIPKERLLRTSQQFEAVSHELIKTILPADFKQIMTIKNNHDESFLNHIYASQGAVENQLLASKASRSEFSTILAFSRRVQAGVIPLLDLYRKKSAKTLGEKLDFAVQDFPTRLAEILEDQVTMELMIDPILISTEGQTFSRSTLAHSNKNPSTNKPFNPVALVPNKRVAEVIAHYTQFLKDHDLPKLVEQMDTLLLAASQADQLAQFSDDAADAHVVPDFKFRELKHLLESYHAFIHASKANAEVVPVAAAAAQASSVPYPLNSGERLIVEYLENIPPHIQVGKWMDLGDGFELGIGRMLQVPAISYTTTFVDGSKGVYSKGYQINLVNGHLSILDKAKGYMEIKDPVLKNDLIYRFTVKITSVKNAAAATQAAAQPTAQALSASSSSFFPSSSATKAVESPGLLLVKLLSMIGIITDSIRKEDCSGLTMSNLKTIQAYMVGQYAKNTIAKTTITRDKELRLLGMISALGKSVPDFPINHWIEISITPQDLSDSNEFRDEARVFFTDPSPSSAAAAVPSPVPLTAESIEHFVNRDPAMSAQHSKKP